MTKQIRVVKFDHIGNEVFHYPGNVLSHQDTYLVVEAFFTHRAVMAGPLLIGQGDRMVEHYYADRWYNIFEIYDRETQALKGRYCNVGYPAKIENGTVSYRDLALDLIVMPDGQQVVLDEDEFAELNLDADTAAKAWQALAELQAMFGESSR